MRPATDPIPTDAYGRLAADLEPAVRGLRQRYARAAALRGVGRACWAGGLTIAATAAISATTAHGAASAVVVGSAVVLGSVVVTLIAGPLVVRRQVSAREAAERLDLAFHTHNAVASALDLSALDEPSATERSAIAVGRDRLAALAAASDLNPRVGGTVDVAEGSWALPLSVLAAGIAVAAAVALLPRSAYRPPVSSRSRSSAALAAATHPGVPPPSPGPDHPPSAGEPSAVGPTEQTAHRGLGSGRSTSAAASGAGAGPPGRNAAAGGATGPAAIDGEPLATALRSSVGGALTDAIAPTTVDPAGARGATAPRSPAGTTAADPAGQQPASGSPPAPGASGRSTAAGVGDKGQPQAGGQPSPGSPGTPGGSQASGQQGSGKASAPSAAATTPPRDGASRSGAKPGAGFGDGDVAQVAGATQPPGRGGNKKSRGVPPLLLGATQADSLAGPLLPGPEQRTTTLVPPQPDPGAVGPPASPPPVASADPPPAVDPARVDAADQPLVARYLVTLHREDGPEEP